MLLTRLLVEVDNCFWSELAFKILNIMRYKFDLKMLKFHLVQRVPGAVSAAPGIVQIVVLVETSEL